MAASPINWRCPFCGQNATITDNRRSSATHYFHEGNRHGKQGLTITVLVCPNAECQEFALEAVLSNAKMHPTTGWDMVTTERARWSLVPEAAVKQFPHYVPSPILTDYREACLIRALSPKASATLARRCLQGMIRDFWGVSKPRLVDEIAGIQDKVDPVTWSAIEAVRSIGNIGAHMERDIDLVIDVDPEEADLLIGLLETLITEWYVGKHEREQRMTKLVSIAAAKKSP